MTSGANQLEHSEAPFIPGLSRIMAPEDLIDAEAPEVVDPEASELVEVEVREFDEGGGSQLQPSHGGSQVSQHPGWPTAQGVWYRS